VAEPPGKIICIGLNDADHAAEAGLRSGRLTNPVAGDTGRP
jgi:hypothetical protein